MAWAPVPVSHNACEMELLQEDICSQLRLYNFEASSRAIEQYRRNHAPYLPAESCPVHQWPNESTFQDRFCDPLWDLRFILALAEELQI
jgi:hypothetical protein